MPEVLNINQINIDQWDKLIENSPTASYFQTKECYDFYCSLSCLKPILYAVSENGTLVGLVCGYLIADGTVVKRFMSRRAIIPGGVLLSRNISEEALSLLLSAVIEELKNRAIYIEFRNYDDFSDYKPVFEKTGFACIPRVNFHIKTDCLEQVVSNISASKRKNIRNSIKYGSEIIEITDRDEVREFYKIISNLYKKKIKTPLFDCEFFEKFAGLPNVKFFGIKYQGKIVGGSGCVVLKNKSVYEWFKCGIDGAYRHIYPSTLATWAGMEFAVKSNVERYDMMGAGKPDERSGIRDFKSKFGGKLVEHGRFLYVCNSFLYKLGKFYIEKVKI